MKPDLSKFAKMTLISGIVCCSITALQLQLAPLSMVSVAQTDSSDEQLIRKGADEFVKAYSAGDASTIANMYAEDSCITESSGAAFHGRAAIKQMYEKNFADYGAQQVSLAISKISFPTSDVAVEECQFSAGNVNSKSTYNIVHVKKDGAWRILSVSEYANSVIPSEALKSLDWMIGDWTLHGANKNVYLRVNSINNGNFLAMRFSDTEGNDVAPAQLQIIGWNSKTKDIVSWNFGHEGGSGYGHWRKDGDSWFITTRGTTHEGDESTADYIIKHADASHFSWESLERSINGLKLPNTGIVEATRRQADSK